jgi:integrase
MTPRFCDVGANRGTVAVISHAELHERVARLERVIPRNSGNSGMSPSGDDRPGKVRPKDKAAKGAAKHRPGKQPGAPGAHLAWSILVLGLRRGEVLGLAWDCVDLGGEQLWISCQLTRVSAAVLRLWL